MRHYIHVNQHIIKANHKSGDRQPVISVKSYRDNQYAHEVLIKGECRVVYSPDNPLKCGATTWIETEDEVIVLR